MILVHARHNILLGRMGYTLEKEKEKENVGFSIERVYI